MGKAKYETMSIDELFTSMQEAAINAHEAAMNDGPVEKQHAWIDILTAVIEEIRNRGNEALQSYLPLLHASHPAVRLSAALAARKFAPSTAVPVLEELSDGKYGGDIAMNARTTLNGMRKRGLLPQINT